MKYGAFVNILQGDREDWAHQFDFIQSLQGIDHVELWIEHALSDDDFAWLNERIASLNIDVIMHAPFVGINLASHDDKLRQYSVDRIIAAAKQGEKLGAKVMTCHSGNVGMWVKREQALDLLADSFAQIVKSTDIMVTLENMPNKRSATYEPVLFAEDILYVIERCPGLKTTVDVGHCLQNDENPASAIEKLRDHIADVHLHDGFINGAAHKALGVGDLDLDETLAALNGYTHYVSLETIGETDTASSWQVVSVKKSS